MQQPKTSGMAIAALVLSFLCFPLGIVLGIIALVQISKSNGALSGQGLAIASLVVSVGFVPILGILAAIAVPNFIRYQLRSKTAEARVHLGSIRTSQEMFRAEKNGYLTLRPTPANSPGTVKADWDGVACPTGCESGDMAACTEFSCFGFEPAGQVYYQYACNAVQGQGAADFTCAAAADLDGDGNYGLFIYGTNNAGGREIVAPIPDFGLGLRCRAPQYSGEVIDCEPGVY